MGFRVNATVVGTEVVEDASSLVVHITYFFLQGELTPWDSYLESRTLQELQAQVAQTEGIEYSGVEVSWCSHEDCCHFDSRDILNRA